MGNLVLRGSRRRWRFGRSFLLLLPCNESVTITVITTDIIPIETIILV
ncbi:MAG: hypothetical protein FGF52_02865 [Candidatus Brockarchaeota archaeon]|nr:hypothetical protein [Candidatus Brockarchaeota archaeon]